MIIDHDDLTTSWQSKYFYETPALFVSLASFFFLMLKYRVCSVFMAGLFLCYLTNGYFMQHIP